MRLSTESVFNRADIPSVTIVESTSPNAVGIHTGYLQHCVKVGLINFFAGDVVAFVRTITAATLFLASLSGN